jgi:cyclophilin family peptidyl-prolyl cis-trans isomerase/HEAT repeat protein
MTGRAASLTHHFRFTLLQAAALTFWCGAPVLAQQPVAKLQQLLVAEDSRGGGSDGIRPLIDNLRSPDSLLRRVAVRAVGRLQRPELGIRLLESLNDPVAAVRREAANGIAQSLKRVRAGSPATDTTQLSAARAAGALIAALRGERDLAVSGAIAEALGRLPLTDSVSVRAIEAAILDRAGADPTYDMVHAFYTLSGRRRLPYGLSPRSVAMLSTAVRTSKAPEVRRLATLTLGGTGTLDSTTTLAAVADHDPQVRRLALAGTARLSADSRIALVQRAMADTSAIVRIEAIATARVGSQRPNCTLIIGAIADRTPYVSLMAIDALGSPCADPAASVTALAHVLDGSLPTFQGPVDHRWQAAAHALRSLAKIDSARAAPFLSKYATSTAWQQRLAAATAAADSRDNAVLMRLASDRDHNVMEEAIAGLAKTRKHDADSVFIAALASPGYQVVLAAATALAGSTHPRMLPAALDAFDRISAPKIENARDPRMALLKRVAEAGTNANAARLQPYLADFDTLVATTVAATLSKWSGTTIAAHPVPLPIRAEPLAETLRSRGLQLKVTMAASSGGGVFTIQLFPDEAPATVARIVRLARAKFYDGHLFQRVEPNFVVQGGGPDASEYVGDTAFMRDELALRTQGIGTLGISARGRDTGDAQWYINIADNPLLDHEYTVFGTITAGLDVALNILEGDRIGTVQVVGGKP